MLQGTTCKSLALLMGQPTKAKSIVYIIILEKQSRSLSISIKLYCLYSKYIGHEKSPSLKIYPVSNSSRSGLHILCEQGKFKDSNINRVQRNFLNDRVLLYQQKKTLRIPEVVDQQDFSNSSVDRVLLIWNKLPSEVKILSSLNVFKSNLEVLRCGTKALGICGSGNFWKYLMMF